MIKRKRIKTVLTLAIMAMVLFAAVANAAVLVYEPFDYTVGALDGVATNAIGLTGNWTAGSITAIESGSMSWGSLPTAGNRVNLSATNNSAQAFCSAALDTSVLSGNLDDGDVLWFSVLARTSGTVTGNGVRFQIGLGANNNVGFLMDQETVATSRVRALKTETGTEELGTGSATFDGGDRLVVGKITFGATDTVDIYLPETDLVLPDTPMSTLDTTLNQVNTDYIRLNFANGNSMVRADEIRIGTSFADICFAIDPNTPSVQAGGDMITWSGELVQLAATATDNHIALPGLNLEWTHDAPAGFTVDFNPSANVEDPDVTITKDDDTGDATVVTLTLTATVIGSPQLVVSDSAEIDVYDDACLAAKGAAVELDSTDFDADCITGLADFALLAKTWLDDYVLTGPVPKP